MSYHSNIINPYTPPSESAELFSVGFDAKSRVFPQWVSIVWDTTLFVIFGFYLPSIVDATSRLFARQPLDLQTVSKLPERWMLAFFLLSLSAYFAVQRHVLWRVVYGVFVLSFLFQHFPTGWFGDLITAGIAAAVFLPVFTHGFGWLGVARSIFVWNAKRPRRVGNDGR
jgi:hypothetical protein